MNYSLPSSQKLSEVSLNNCPGVQEKMLLEEYVSIMNILNSIVQEKDSEQQQNLAKVVIAKIAANASKFFSFLKLHKELENEFKNHPVASHLSSLAFINLNALKSYALHYFEEIYQDQKISEISFCDKTEGEQLGTVLKITAQDSLKSYKISYHIKIYQYEGRDECDFIRPLDPKELLVYQILDYIGLGEEVHFFYDPNSFKSFYIATKDAGYYKTSETESSFSTYQGLIEEELYQINPENVDENIIYGLLCIDILARILKLDDLTMNSGNFGFVRKKHRTKVKILDFCVRKSFVYNQKGLYEEFIAGIGTTNPFYPDKIFEWICMRSPEYKIERAKKFILELKTENHKKKTFLNAVEASWCLVNDILKRYEKDLKVESPQLLNKDFHRYYQDIMQNYELFRTKIE